jgi:hypothetical protein
VPKTSLLHLLEEEDDQQTFGSPAFYSNDTDRGGDTGGQSAAKERPILSIFKMLNGNRSGLSVKDVFNAQKDLSGGKSYGSLVRDSSAAADHADENQGSDGEGEEEEQEEEEVEEGAVDSLHPDPRFRFRPADNTVHQVIIPSKTRILPGTSGPVWLDITPVMTTTTRSTTRQTTTTTRTTSTTTTTASTTPTTLLSWSTPRTTPVPPYVQAYDRYSWDAGGQYRGQSLADRQLPPASYLDPVYDTGDTGVVRPEKSESDSGAMSHAADYSDNNEEPARHYPRDHFFPMSIEPSQHNKDTPVRFVAFGSCHKIFVTHQAPLVQEL